MVGFTLRPLHRTVQTVRTVSQQISKRDLRSSDTTRNITRVTGARRFEATMLSRKIKH